MERDDGAGATAVAPGDEAYATWRRGVAAVLARSRGVPADELGPAPDERLVVTTEDGLTVRPLYTDRDELPEWPPPGVAPYVRGSRPPGTPWRLCVPVPDLQQEFVRPAVDGGAGALWVTRDKPTPGTLGVGMPVALSAPAAMDDVVGELSHLPDADVCLGVDALSPLLRGEPVPGTDLAQRARSLPGDVRAYVVDGTVLHEAGATAVDEVGAVVAAGIATVRALVEADMPVEHALGQIDFRLSVSDDQFGSIAKLRAARQCWARVGEVLGAPGAAAMRQHAVTSAAMTSRLDPWVNLLRGTVAAFAAGVGGAALVTVRPFDEPVPGGQPGTAPGLSERLARTTQLLLLEEAHLGHVADPAGGSWYVESLTGELAAAAWALVQELEVSGLLVLAERVAAATDARDAEVAHRRRKLTGVNEFPDPGEPARMPTPTIDGAYAARRYGAAYESLRARSDAQLVDAGARPQVFLAPLGTVAEHNARVTFATNLLAAGGIVARYPGALEAQALLAAFRESGATMAVLAGTDDAYAASGAATVAALRAAGATTVLAAGRADAFPEGGPDGYVGLGIDAVAALSGLLDSLGVA